MPEEWEARSETISTPDFCLKSGGVNRDADWVGIPRWRCCRGDRKTISILYKMCTESNVLLFNMNATDRSFRISELKRNLWWPLDLEFDFETVAKLQKCFRVSSVLCLHRVKAFFFLTTFGQLAKYSFHFLWLSEQLLSKIPFFFHFLKVSQYFSPHCLCLEVSQYLC